MRASSALGCALLLLLPLASCIGPGLEPPGQGGSSSPRGPANTPPPPAGPADAGVPGDFGNPSGQPQMPGPNGDPTQPPDGMSMTPPNSGSAGTSAEPDTEDDDAGIP